MLSTQLKKHLSERDLSISEFAEMCDLPLETVRNVYYGKTTDPKLSTVEKMASALHLSINCLLGKCSHTPQERAVIMHYRSCGAHGKSIIELIARYEAGAVKNERELLDKHRIPCIIPHSDIRNGIIYDQCETVDIETFVKEAYVAIKMVNNDLVPIYCKDDIILFEDRFPNNGEYAGFFKNGRAYIRKFIEEAGVYRLKCLHRSGEDIVLKRMDEIDYIGTCIAAVRA